MNRYLELEAFAVSSKLAALKRPTTPDHRGLIIDHPLTIGSLLGQPALDEGDDFKTGQRLVWCVIIAMVYQCNTTGLST